MIKVKVISSNLYNYIEEIIAYKISFNYLLNTEKGINHFFM